MIVNHVVSEARSDADHLAKLGVHARGRRPHEDMGLDSLLLLTSAAAKISAEGYRSSSLNLKLYFIYDLLMLTHNR